MTRGFSPVAVVALFIGGGCIHSTTVACGDNVCVQGAQCDEASGQCKPLGCGNGQLDPGEDCDDTLFALRDCHDLGYYDVSALGCTSLCAYDTSACTGSCGDHLVNGPELCDGLPPEGQSCIDYGFSEGRLGCSSACTPTFETCNQFGWPSVFAETTGALHALAQRANTVQFYAAGDHGVLLELTAGIGGAPVQVPLPADLADAPLRTVWVAPQVGGIMQPEIFVGTATGVLAWFRNGAWSEDRSTGVEVINGLWGTSGTDVYAVGGTISTPGTASILHFTGSAWSSDASPSAPNLLAVTGAADGSVIAVGLKGTILRHAAGTWTQDTTPTPNTYDLYAVASVGDHLFAAGTNEHGTSNGAYVLVDSAATPGTWKVVGPGADVGTTPNPFDNIIHSIAGTAADDVYLGGVDGLMLHFDGKAFHRVLIDTTRSIDGIVMRERGRGVAVSFGGEALAYSAVEWIDAAPIAPTSVELDAVATANGDWLAAGSEGTIVESVDGGATWTAANVGGVAADYAGVWMAPSADPVQFAVAVTGNLMNTAYAVVREAGPAGTPFQVMPTTGNFNANWGAVWGRSRTDFFLAGAKSNLPWVLHCMNGSTSTACAVETIPSNATGKITGLWGGAGATDPVFAVTADGNVIERTAGVWARVLDTGSTMTAVWGSSPTDVFVVGYSGRVEHFDGTAWTTQFDDGIVLLESVGGTGPRDVYAGAPDGIFHYDGVAWTPVAQPVLTTMSGVAVDAQPGRTVVRFVGTRGESAALERTPTKPGTPESRCTDGFDDDYDGAIDCADSDCARDPACLRGGACAIAAALVCETTSRAGTTFAGNERVDQLPSLAAMTAGPETTYLFQAQVSATITVTLDGIADGVDLQAVALDTLFANTNACDLSHAIASASQSGAGLTLAFPVVAGRSYLIVLDAAAAASGFTISVSCS